MNTFSIEHIKKYAQDIGFSPSRSRGQNFLIDEQVLDDIILSADPKPDENILEVGPGFGVLTMALLTKKTRVIAIEAETKLAELLKRRTNKLPVKKNLTIINEDVRTVNMTHIFPQQHYRVIANLPYNITSWFIRNMLENAHHPTAMTLLLQKEVAERIVAKPGQLNLLGLSVQYYAQPHVVRLVKKESFWPSPTVDSALVYIQNIHTPNFPYAKSLFRVMRVGFSGKRKQIKNTLKNGLGYSEKTITTILKAAHIEPTARPQEIPLEKWKMLTETIEQHTK